MTTSGGLEINPDSATTDALRLEQGYLNVNGVRINEIATTVDTASPNDTTLVTEDAVEDYVSGLSSVYLLKAGDTGTGDFIFQGYVELEGSIAGSTPGSNAWNATLPSSPYSGVNATGLRIEGQSAGDTFLFLMTQDAGSGFVIWHDQSANDTYFDARDDASGSDIIFRTRTAGTDQTALTLSDDDATVGDDLSVGGDVTVTGMVTSGNFVTGTFTSGNLVSDVLTVNHAKGQQYPYSVTVYNNSNEMVVPSNVTATDTNNLSLDFTGVTITGTWRYYLIF